MKLMKTLAMATLLASLSTSLVQADTRVFLRTTDNVSGAGTDSNIWMRLHGSNGKQSKRLRLQDVIVWHEQWQSNGVPLGVIDDILEGGVTGYFDVSTDLGQAITKIDIESDGRYPGSDWHLDRVISFTESGDNKISTWGIPLMMSVAVSGEVDGYTSLGGISTFVWEDWIKGDEEKLTGTDGRKARGIEIVRKEPMTKKNGKGETVAAVIQIVYVANALGSTSKATNSFKYTTTRHESLRQVDKSSTSIKIGAAVSYGYQPASASGGNKWEASLSSEFQHVSGNINEQVFGTDSKSEVDETFSAQPDTMQLRILETQGAVTQQSYTSTLSGQKFAAQYIANANPFDIEEVTFTAGEGAAADQRWNQIAALPVAVSMGELGYKRLVKKLTNANALANPLSYADAIKQ